MCIATECTVDPRGQSAKKEVTRVAKPLPLRGFAIESEALPPPPTNRSATCGWASPGPAIAGHGLPGWPSSLAVWPPLLLWAINHPPDNDPTARQANRISLQHGRREEEHIVCCGTISVGSIAVQKNWLDPTTRVGSPRCRAAPRHSEAGSPLSSIPEIRRVGNTGRTSTRSPVSENGYSTWGKKKLGVRFSP